ETERNAVIPNGAETAGDESTVTLRELIYEKLRAMRVQTASGVEVIFADGRKLRFHHAEDPRLDEVVKRADVSEVRSSFGGKAYGPTVDDSMESIMDRYDNLFRRLAEGTK
ncbi:MAG TPA: hypothetical protein VFY40_15775, partial [Blastocatellia bacterium]|nr:hypothetical protein [Blastocatellia bacterium]